MPSHSGKMSGAGKGSMGKQGVNYGTVAKTNNKRARQKPGKQAGRRI